MFDIVRKEIMWGGRKLSLETGRIARQANGAVLARYGDTVSLMPGGVAAQVPLLRGVVTSLEPALAASPDDPELASILMQTLGRLAEIEGNTFTAEPGRAESARATVEQALALAERAWPRSEEQWRSRGRHLEEVARSLPPSRAEGVPDRRRCHDVLLARCVLLSR